MEWIIDVDCRPVADGWSCRVTVTEHGASTNHDVSVSSEVLARLAPESPDPVDLVRRSFAFLLARERKESILGRFELPLIGRYFPEYERTIRQG